MVKKAMSIKTKLMMGALHNTNEEMVFDWVKAAKLIKKHKPKIVCAGLAGDWERTGGTIYTDGEMIKNTRTFLASSWARPQLYIKGKIISCFIMQSKTTYNEDTKWPKEAVAILQG